MNRKSLIYASCFLVLLPLVISCGSFDDIVIGEPNEVKVRGFEENFLVVDVALPVSNPTLYPITLKDIDMRVYLNDKYIGKLMLDDKVKIKPKSSEVYHLPVKVRMANVLGTAFIMMTLKKGSSPSFRFEGEVDARGMLIKKTIHVDETKNIEF
jgi:LEA14-like dessication related protein